MILYKKYKEKKELKKHPKDKNIDKTSKKEYNSTVKKQEKWVFPFLLSKKQKGTGKKTE